MLDLEFFLADSDCLVPVYLSPVNALKFSPIILVVREAQVGAVLVQ
jgi:hypothetical protein